VCPDAVFEIRSPSDALRDVRAKMRVYLENGAQVAVLIDPERRAVEVCEPGGAPRIFEQVPSVALDPVLAGFTLNLESIFS
jgi:Uma2 family endonuclease